MNGKFLLVPLALSTALGGPPPAGGQGVESIPEGRVVEVRTDPEAPAFGEVFDLHLTLRVGPEWVVFLPDTLLPTEAAESAGAGSWTGIGAPGDSVDVQARYPVLGYREALVEFPWIELLLRPSGPGDAAVEARVRPAAAAGPQELGADPQRRWLRLGAVDLGVYEPLEEGGLGSPPRPPADVLGGGYGLAVVIGGGILVLVLLGGVGLLIREMRGRGSPAAGPLRGVRTAREAALHELDRILESGKHRNGRVDEFYAASSDVLREYAAGLDAAWGTDLTSHELVRELGTRWGGEGVDALSRVVDGSERVKFGRSRPTPETAEEDWRVMRDWVRRWPEGR